MTLQMKHPGKYSLHIVYSLPVNAKEVASSAALSSCEKWLSKSDGEVESIRINVTFDNLRRHVKHVSWMLERHATSLIEIACFH